MTDPGQPRVIVKKCTTDLLGTTCNELPDGYEFTVHHQEGSNWVVVATAYTQLSTELVGEPVLSQVFRYQDPTGDLVRVVEGESHENRAPGGPLRGVENPEPDYGTPAFDAVWEVVRHWDIERVSGQGYAGATGTDVQVILDALRTFLEPGTLRSSG